MPAFIPEWLLRLILGYAVKWLYKKVGLDATVVHIETAIAKTTPLKPDSNSPPIQGNNPNLKDHYGG